MQMVIEESKEGDHSSIKQVKEIIQRFFIRSPRSGNARQADGSWEKGEKADGFSIGGRRVPALCLGTLKL